MKSHLSLQIYNMFSFKKCLIFISFCKKTLKINKSYFFTEFENLRMFSI